MFESLILASPLASSGLAVWLTPVIASMALLIGGGVFVLLILWFIGLYNGLVRARNETRNAWSQIDVQLKRRHDLV